MLPLQKNQKNSYSLKLNKQLYKKSALDQLLKEDKGWVNETKSRNADYFEVILKTSHLSDALEWTNYLFYLSKTT